MTILENPFVGTNGYFSKDTPLRQLIEHFDACSLDLLLTTYRTVEDTATLLARTVPGSSLQLAWQVKVETARREYLAFAQRLGIDLKDAEAKLANSSHGSSATS
jgi:hypothetical protein